MKKREIVVLDCGVEVRSDHRTGIVFTAYDPGREFAFCIRQEEIPDMISYLNSYLGSLDADTIKRLFVTGIAGVANKNPAQRELTPVEKAAQAGVTAQVLADPGLAKSGRVVPASAVSVHKG